MQYPLPHRVGKCRSAISKIVALLVGERTPVGIEHVVPDAAMIVWKLRPITLPAELTVSGQHSACRRQEQTPGTSERRARPERHPAVTAKRIQAADYIAAATGMPTPLTDVAPDILQAAGDVADQFGLSCWVRRPVRRAGLRTVVVIDPLVVASDGAAVIAWVFVAAHADG